MKLECLAWRQVERHRHVGSKRRWRKREAASGARGWTRRLSMCRLHAEKQQGQSERYCIKEQIQTELVRSSLKGVSNFGHDTPCSPRSGGLIWIYKSGLRESLTRGLRAVSRT
jgi:hypothetical protein